MGRDDLTPHVRMQTLTCVPELVTVSFVSRPITITTWCTVVDI